jgi:transposase
MKKTQETQEKEDGIKLLVLYMAFDLGNTKWKLALSDGSKMRYVSIEARNFMLLHEEIKKTKTKFGLADDVQILSCYEAGRDGFWIHHYLENCGIENLIVDSSSLEVNRRKRRAKTDRIDARKLLSMLIRYHRGEKKLWSVVRVPTVEEEDGRELHRELESLKKERNIHRNRIGSFLISQGIQIKNPSAKNFLKHLESLRTWDGRVLPKDLKARVVREYERLRMVEDQIRALKKEREQRVKREDSISLQQVVRLRSLRGIGAESSWVFVMEFFGWRNFQNRREVGGLAGLTPTPFDSGNSYREQGISKAGNWRVRALSVEIAWAWLRFQPQSKLSRWYNKRFANGGKRMRRIGIVAMARRLLIDLWRYLDKGTFPEGARLKDNVIITINA